MKLILSLLLLICSITVFSQNFTQKPFLEMQTTASGKTKVYRLKKKNTIWIKTTSDSVLIKDKIIGFTYDSALSLQKHGMIGLSEIEVIRFTPLRLSRTIRQVSYTLGISSELFILTYASLAPVTDGASLLFFIIVTPVYTVVIAEGLAGLSYILKKKIILTRENTHFIIRYSQAPPPHGNQLPYTPN